MAYQYCASGRSVPVDNSQPYSNNNDKGPKPSVFGKYKGGIFLLAIVVLSLVITFGNTHLTYIAHFAGESNSDRISIYSPGCAYRTING
jgi:hypothetical protein